jgi:arylsulfatase A-like enzyme
MALLTLGAVACGPAPAPRPDVVLIDVDSLRADHLAHLGYERATSVGLDAFRADATLFANAWAPSSASAASSASLLTGLGVDDHGVSGARLQLGEEISTLAEILKGEGFATAALSHHFELSRASGFGQGFDLFESAAGPIEAYPDAGAMVASLREWLATEPAAPFFLYLHPMNAHGPYRVPANGRGALFGRPASRTFDYAGDAARAVMSGRRPVRRMVTDAMVRSLVEQYDAAVRYTLDRVGEMIELLQRNGRYDDALIIVVGNHGEELFDHGGFGHGFTLHGEVLRVPLYVKLPGGVGGNTVETPVSTLDVVPTVLESLGLAARPGAGRSLGPLLRGEAQPPLERSFEHRLDEPQNGADQRAIVRERYKLIDMTRRYDLPRGGVALYDLVLDPAEEKDLAAEAPQIVEQLRAELESSAAGAEER